MNHIASSSPPFALVPLCSGESFFTPPTSLLLLSLCLPASFFFHEEGLFSGQNKKKRKRKVCFIVLVILSLRVEDKSFVSAADLMRVKKKWKRRVRRRDGGLCQFHAAIVLCHLIKASVSWNMTAYGILMSPQKKIDKYLSRCPFYLSECSRARTLSLFK